MSCFGTCRRTTVEWLQNRTCTERVLMVFLIFLIILMIILGSSHSDTAVSQWAFCSSSVCLTEASKLLRFRNSSANPCKSFYSYSCGNFLVNARRMEKIDLREFQDEQLLEFYHKEIRHEDHHVIQTAKTLFQTCIKQRDRDLQQTEKLISILKKAGGWPVLEGSNWKENEFDWVNTTYTFRERGYHYKIFLDLTVEPDPQDQNSYIYKTATADVMDYLYSLNELEKIELMTEVALVFGAKDRENVYKQMTDVYNFRKILSENQFPVKSKGVFERSKLKHFQSEFGDMFNWISFNNIILGHPYKLSRHHDQLFVPITNLKNWIKIINGTSKLTQANYMMWTVIEQTIPYMHCELRVAKGGVRKYENFEEYCLRETEKRFVVSPMRLIIDGLYLTETKKKGMEEIVSHFKSAFMEFVENAKWLEEQDKLILTERARNLDFVIGRPNDHYGDDILDQLVVDMMDLENQSFMELIAQANRNYASMIYNQFKLKRSESLLDKLYINNYKPKYVSDRNLLFVPGAVLQLYIDEDKPKYLIYGEMGALLGQHFAEMLKDAINRTTWTGSTKQIFNDEVLCLDKETQNCIEFQLLPPEMCPRRSILLAQEAIAYKAAYSAYTKLKKKLENELPLIETGYTQEQLFWMSAGAMSCPRHFLDMIYKRKIHISISDDNNFNEAFNCPKKSSNC